MRHRVLFGGGAAMACALGISGMPLATSHAAAPSTKPAAVQAYPLNEQTAQLKLVDVVFRHGARTPLSKRQELWQRTGAQWDVCQQAYPAVPLSLVSATGGPASTGPHNEKQVSQVYPGGCHMGQLTHVGQLQARELGQWLRRRYVEQLKLLPQSYQEGVLVTRTTPYQRTIATLAGVLTGLLGPPTAGSRPIPTVTSTDMDEILYADTRTCPHLEIFMRMAKDKAVDLVRRDPEYEWVNDELDRLGYSLPGHHRPKDWFFADLHDVVTALSAAGKPIPEGFSPRLVKALNRLATKEFAPLVAPSIRDHYGHSMLRLSMGVLLHTLIDNMQTAAAAGRGANTAEAKAAAQPRMHLYSGHDSTIMPLLSALGHDDLDSWPPFLSNLIFELWQLPESEGGHHVVRVLYNREELDLPHCPPGRYLSLETFRSEVLLPFLLSQSDMREACKVPVGHDTSLPSLQESGSGPGSSADE